MTGADIRVVAHLVTIPINLLLIAWVGVGRTALLPAENAAGVPLTLSVVAPALVLLLGITSALAIGQRRGGDDHLTGPQFGLLLGCWLAVAGFGFFLVDRAVDGAWTGSPFTQLTADRFVALSDALTVACLYGFVAAYITLLILLVRGVDGARGRRRSFNGRRNRPAFRTPHFPASPGRTQPGRARPARTRPRPNRPLRPPLLSAPRPRSRPDRTRPDPPGGRRPRFRRPRSPARSPRPTRS